MRVRCIAERPTAEQIRLLGRSYAGDRQVFGIERGAEYVVFALDFYGCVTWVQITNEHDHLLSVPLFLFEVTDAKVPGIWEARSAPDGGLRLWPPSFYRDFYHEDLLEGVPDIVADLQHVRNQLLTAC